MDVSCILPLCSRARVTWILYIYLEFWDPSIFRERLKLETRNLYAKLQDYKIQIWYADAKCHIPMTINRSNRNRKYNSNMADFRFHKSAVITQPWIELPYRRADTQTPLSSLVRACIPQKIILLHRRANFGDALQSNIIFCDIYYFRSASWRKSSFIGVVNG